MAPYIRVIWIIVLTLVVSLTACQGGGFGERACKCQPRATPTAPSSLEKREGGMYERRAQRFVKLFPIGTP